MFMDMEGEKNMKYYVDFIATGRYTAEVEADSVEEAKELAKHKWENADFGELEDVGEYGCEYGTVEDENGKLFD